MEQAENQLIQHGIPRRTRHHVCIRYVYITEFHWTIIVQLYLYSNHYFKFLLLPAIAPPPSLRLRPCSIQSFRVFFVFSFGNGRYNYVTYNIMMHNNMYIIIMIMYAVLPGNFGGCLVTNRVTHIAPKNHCENQE